jgi:HlyD family secretion protein
MPRGPPRQTASRPDARGPNRTVWVLRDGAPASVAVTVGATDGKLTEIKTGALKPGDRVIVDAVAAKP